MGETSDDQRALRAIVLVCSLRGASSPSSSDLLGRQVLGDLGTQVGPTQTAMVGPSRVDILSKRAWLWFRSSNTSPPD